MSPSPAAPWLLCWQGLLAGGSRSRLRRLLPQIAGGMLCALLLVLPMATARAWLADCRLRVAVAGVGTRHTTCATAPGGHQWLVAVFLAIALVATGLSPVPAAAAKGLLKLLSYLGVYALMRRLWKAHRNGGTVCWPPCCWGN